MNKHCMLLLATLLYGFPLRSQAIFDHSIIHEVKITSLYSGLPDTLTLNYILSFDFLQRQIRDIPYTVCKVELDGTTLDTIGIRYKGFNSWWSSSKKPLKLDLNRYKKGQNYQGFKKLNLHNRASDPTFLRDGFCYALFRDMGIPAPRTAFARVYFDGVYAGLYQLVEEIDNEFLDAHFGDHKGNLYKQSSAGSAGYTLDWLGSQPESYYPHIELENHNSENDWSGLVHFIEVLNNTSDPVFADSIAALFDVESFLRVLALDLAVNNLDYYANSGRNYFLYHDTGGDGKMHWLPWDYNLSWRENAPPLEPDIPASPVLIRRLLGIPKYRQAFWEQYCTLRQYFDSGVLIPRMTADSALIRPALESDPSGDYTLTDFGQNFSSTVNNLPGLKPFLNQRSTEIDQFLQAKGVDCSLVTGTEQPATEPGSLHLFPNPATDEITVQWPENFIPETKTLYIFDAMGHLVQSDQLPATGDSQTVELGNTQTGVYFVRVVSGLKSTSSRFVIRR